MPPGAVSVEAQIETDEQVLEARREAAEARRGKKLGGSWGRPVAAGSGAGANSKPAEPDLAGNDNVGAPREGSPAGPVLGEETATTPSCSAVPPVPSSSHATAALTAAAHFGARASGYALSNLDYALSNLASVPTMSGLVSVMPANFGLWTSSGVPSSAAAAPLADALASASLIDKSSAEGASPQSTSASPTDPPLGADATGASETAAQAALPGPGRSSSGQPSPEDAKLVALAIRVAESATGGEWDGEGAFYKPTFPWLGVLEALLLTCVFSSVGEDEGPLAAKAVSVTLIVRPQPAVAAAAGPSMSGWVYGAAASTVGRFMAHRSWGAGLPAAKQDNTAVEQGSGSLSHGFANAPSSSMTSAAATVAAAAPLVMQSLGLQTSDGSAAATSPTAGDSDDDAMLEDLNLVLSGALDGGHEHGLHEGARTHHPYPVLQTRHTSGGGAQHSYVTGGGGSGTETAASSSRGTVSEPQPLASLHEAKEEPTQGGTNIRLHFDLLPSCSEQQQWERQAGRCGGCREALPAMPLPPPPTPPPLPDPGGSLQTARPERHRGSAAGNYLHWGGSGVSAAAAVGPRVCWYTGGLYCHECHQAQTCVLPSRVLHSWDLLPRPVCCAAYDYLAAIREQPLLCVTAVNPSLYTK